MRLAAHLLLAALLCTILSSTPLLPEHDPAIPGHGWMPLLPCDAALVPDCCCEREAIDMAHDERLQQQLQRIRSYTFFRMFKVDLHSECPFWQDNSQCMRRNCAVTNECSEEEIPSCPDPASSQLPPSDPVDRTLHRGFHGWAEKPEEDDRSWIDTSVKEEDMVYVNMELNPEIYTGYEGEGANRVWKAIHAETCLSAKAGATVGGSAVSQNEQGSSSLLRPASPASNLDAQCLEYRMFSRLTSGLFSSISAHIAWAYPASPDISPHTDLRDPANAHLVAPHLGVFQAKLGNYPDRLANLYFAFVLMLRALNKAAPTLRVFNYSTGSGGVGSAAEAQELSQLVTELLSSPLVSHCAPDASFDESSLFPSGSAGVSLKKRLRGAFRNISRLMNCVGCEQCRLHGKLQILGLGTALRILFEHDDRAHADATGHVQTLPLVRNEVMALIVTLAKFSNALRIVKQMQALEKQMATEQEAFGRHGAMLSQGLLGLGGGPVVVTCVVGVVTALALLLWRRRARKDGA